MNKKMCLFSFGLFFISICLTLSIISGGMFYYAYNNSNMIFNLSSQLSSDMERGKRDVLVEFEASENKFDDFLNIAIDYNSARYMDYSMLSISPNNFAHLDDTDADFKVSVSGFSYAYSSGQLYPSNVVENIHFTETQYNLHEQSGNIVQIIIPNLIADKIIELNPSFNDYNDIVLNNYQIKFNDIEEYVFEVAAIYNPNRQSRFNWFYKDMSFGNVILVDYSFLNYFDHTDIRYFFSFNEEPFESSQNVGILDFFSSRYMYPSLEINEDFADSGISLFEYSEIMRQELQSGIYIFSGVALIVLGFVLFLIIFLILSKSIDYVFKTKNSKKTNLFVLLLSLSSILLIFIITITSRTFLPTFSIGQCSLQTITRFSFWTLLTFIFIIIIHSAITYFRYRQSFYLLNSAEKIKNSSSFLNYCLNYEEKNNNSSNIESSDTYQFNKSRKRMVIVASSANYDVGAAGTRVDTIVDIFSKIDLIDAHAFLKSNTINRGEIIRQGNNFKMISLGSESKGSKLGKLFKSRKNEFKNIFENIKPDIVYVYSTINPFLAKFIKSYCIKNKIEIYYDVVEFRGFPIPFFTKSFSYSLQNYLMNHHFIDNKANGVFCCSSLLVDFFKNKRKINNICYLPILSRKVEYNPVPKRTNKITYLFLGFHIDDIDEIIVALNALDERILNVIRVIICGISAHDIIFKKHLSLEEFKKSLKYCTYVGRLPLVKVFKLLSCSDYSLIKLKKHSKLSQGGFASRIPQSFSFGVPVICTTPGDTSIYVKDGINAFAAKNESVEAYSDALLRSVKLHHNHYSNMSKQAYSTFLSLTANSFVDKVHDFMFDKNKRGKDIFSSFEYHDQKEEKTND